MGRKGLLIKQFLNNAFVTTAIVLIVLSVVALWYDGTMICISTIFETLLLSVVCEVIKHMMYKIDIANIYLGILLHYLLVLAAVLIFGYVFNWVNQLPVYVLAGMCGVVLILCCYLDISRVKADIDEINVTNQDALTLIDAHSSASLLRLVSLIAMPPKIIEISYASSA